MWAEVGWSPFRVTTPANQAARIDVAQLGDDERSPGQRSDIVFTEDVHNTLTLSSPSRPTAEALLPCQAALGKAAENGRMQLRIQNYSAGAIVVGLIAFNTPAPALAQDSPGKTSGPAAGGNVKPQTSPDVSGMTGPAGSKNGPASKAPDSAATRNDGSPRDGASGNAAGVAGPAGSKNGPAQGGSNAPK
jgi:hypothetical protein